MAWGGSLLSTAVSGFNNEQSCHLHYFTFCLHVHVYLQPYAKARWSKYGKKWNISCLDSLEHVRDVLAETYSDIESVEEFSQQVAGYYGWEVIYPISF